MTTSDVRLTLLHGLTKAGRRTPPVVPRLLNRVANHLETGRRLRERGMAVPVPATDKFDVFAAAIADAVRAQAPLYVEFGVFEGASLFEWARRVTTGAAHFVGFDSFEGLPEDWSHAATAGTFSTEGQMPRTDDPRVQFVKGWFQDTVPSFVAPPHDFLIVNVDGDLYSSAVTSLNWTATNLAVGDYLYFDEFHDRLHEGRAFHEFVEATGFGFSVIAATHGMVNTLLRRVS